MSLTDGRRCKKREDGVIGREERVRRTRWGEREGLGSPSSVRSMIKLLQDTNKRDEGDRGAEGPAEMRR